MTLNHQRYNNDKAIDKVSSSFMSKTSKQGSHSLNHERMYQIILKI